VTGFLLGLCFAAGIALLLLGDRTAVAWSWSSRADDEVRDLLRDAGVAWRPLALAGACAAAGLVAALVAVVVSGLPVLVLVCACAGAVGPIAWLRGRREQRGRERERAWPDALRQLADALEAGLAFSAAVRLVGEAGPTPLRADWLAFQARSRASGLATAIDGLTERDERTAETVALLLRAGLLELPAGGMAPALRELAGVLSERFEARERARSRATSLRTEAAVLALSPILLLFIVGAASPLYLDAYRTSTGTLVAAAGGLIIFGCWLAMRRLGRVPEPRRSGGRS
jgi:tight adherence protein B